MLAAAQWLDRCRHNPFQDDCIHASERMCLFAVKVCLRPLSGWPGADAIHLNTTAFMPVKICASFFFEGQGKRCSMLVATQFLDRCCCNPPLDN
eukprot:scaffold59661_cov20-Tisochrysis_lutea.AAC.4